MLDGWLAHDVLSEAFGVRAFTSSQMNDEKARFRFYLMASVLDGWLASWCVCLSTGWYVNRCPSLPALFIARRFPRNPLCPSYTVQYKSEGMGMVSAHDRYVQETRDGRQAQKCKC